MTKKPQIATITKECTIVSTCQGRSCVFKGKDFFNAFAQFARKYDGSKVNVTITVIDRYKS